MLLVIDVGNTNVVLGIFKDDKLLKDWRIRTERNITDDEFYVIASTLFKSSGFELKDIKYTAISSVVPPVMNMLNSFCLKYIGHTPKWVDAKSVDIMPILYSNPSEVGSDRIVNSIAAFNKYKTALIIIDFGTATTFDVVSEKGEYIGGAISPGIMISSEALFQHASKLPRVEIFNPQKNVIGKDTVSSMKSGIIYGYASLVDGMVNRIIKEMEATPKVIATGGLAPLMYKISETIESVESSLCLEGLKIICDYYYKGKP
ncbi:MAG: type III pantothenate kinase [Desulfobacterales bacterium]|nr:type III pantothenate kinase [Desulfobacterales bacterium]